MLKECQVLVVQLELKVLLDLKGRKDQQDLLEVKGHKDQ